MKLSNPFIILSIGVLAAGLFKHVTHSEKDDIIHEQWMSVMYLSGFIFLLISPWLILIWNFSQLKVYSWWFAPIIVAAIFGIFYYFGKSKKGLEILHKRPIQKSIEPLVYFGNALGKVLDFVWLQKTFMAIYNALSQLSTFVLKILEGDGGLLWGLLFLALISSVIMGVQLP